MITGDMKISEILKKYPQTLEVFIKMSPHFKKLENKFLRKVLASRVNVFQASAIAGVDPNLLLFELNKAINPHFSEENLKNVKIEVTNTITEKPEFLIKLPEDKIVKFDVRPILDEGKDPFNDIMKKIKELKHDEVLLIINSFEPIPLYSVLGSKGFAYWTEKDNGIFKIYFFRKSEDLKTEGSEDITYRVEGLDFENIVEIDVRGLVPPEPMIKILETLSQLDDKSALLVHHHREPMMLYPKLEERGYRAISNKIDENYFKVLIFKVSGKSDK